MTTEPRAPKDSTDSVLRFVIEVEERFQSLLRGAPGTAAAQTGLGGQLVYVGELNAEGRAWMAAANIAGAASLAATADAATQKQAVRAGIADFLVTNLDEALRILKNEIRKRETVAVCIGAEAGATEQEMQQRGVQPGLWTNALALGAPGLEFALLTWSVTASPAEWLPKLDALALKIVEGDAAAERWLRLAPRYLGREARGLRVLRCSAQAAQALMAAAQHAVATGAIAADVVFESLKG